ncbi:MAG: GAF domain-containing sensor histidine kinase [Anaerolineales bacterium]
MNNKTVQESTILVSSRWLRLARILWYPAAAVVLGIFIASLPRYFYSLSSGSLVTLQSLSNWNFVLNLAFAVGSISAAFLSLALAWVLYRQKPGERMAIFLSFFLLYYGVVFAGPMWTLAYQWTVNKLPIVAPELSLIVILIISSLFYPLLIAMVLLFPDGRFVPAWTRWFVILSITIIPLDYAFFTSTASFLASPLLWMGIFLYSTITLIAFYAQIYRYREVSDPIERQQTKWVVYGLSLMLLCFAITAAPYLEMLLRPPGSPLMWWGAVTSLIYSISLTFLPISLTIAVLRYRLYDIDFLFNRTLVYGALTITTMGIYVFIVGYLGNIFQAINQSAFAFLATGLVALIFQPLRQRLQRAVNRLMFGERDDPLSVLNSLSKRLEVASEPDAIVPSIVETVGQALKLPYVAIEVFNGTSTHIIAAYGESRGISERLPLIHQSKTIGQLVFARRSSHESFSDAEYELLRNIARQTGAAVHAAKLTADLRRSRQQLVTAREEERRRLRRDLHDGLGPTLAGATLRIDIARNKLVSDPDQADTILVETKEQIQDTIGDIRRLVYELRPPALDDMGLVNAVRSFVDQQKIDGLKISIDDSKGLSTLPAAVEVAAYRIALEGITNIIRHAQATAAVIRFSPERDKLTLEIVDNGIGLPEAIPVGVGMTSMRERAEELGGQLKLIPQSPGTLLRACLPCPEE